MLTCRFVTDRLTLYLAGELDPRLAEKVAAHLVRCGRCARVAAELAETDAAVAEALHGPVVAPSTLEGRVFTAIQNLPPPAPAQSVRPRRPLWPGRLALATGLLLGGFALGRLPLPTRPELDLAALAAAPGGPSLASTFAPAFPGTALRCVDGQRVRVQGRDARRWTYDWDGRPVALYTLDARTIDLPQLRRRVFDRHCLIVGERDGYAYALWCTGTTHHVLMARTTPEKLLPLASAALTAGPRSERRRTSV